jgi:hypothetical protein
VHKLKCHKCGQRIEAGDTTIIRMSQRRFEERKHCCPNCSALIAIEIGPSDDTQTALPAFDQTLTGTDVL